VHVGQAPVPRDLDVVELAAWTSLARAILNLPEVNHALVRDRWTC